MAGWGRLGASPLWLAGDASSSALGSDSWLGAEAYETGSVLHPRAIKFLSAVKWNVLAGIASEQRGGIPCRYETKFSIGHFNMVRRIVFDDNISWVARLRLPDDDTFEGREALEGLRAMEIEVASMKLFERKTSILVPRVMSYNTLADNKVGAPYILMDYIHGSVALELREAKSCAPQLFGTPEQDRKFREQMARMQATVASFCYPQIGSLYYSQETDDSYIGTELQTGKGPWNSSTEYYHDLISHLLKAATEEDLRQHQSFMLPAILGHLMDVYSEEKNGPFRLTNRDFGAHNILVDDNFDGVMAAPLGVVAQYPLLSFLEVEPPGIVDARPTVMERVKRTAIKLREYKELLAKAELEQSGGNTKVADRFGSKPASIYKGMVSYGQHQDFVNEIWMESCLKMMREYAESFH